MQAGTASVSIGDVTINQNSQGAPISLGTTGGNEKDITSRFCCSGTLGALVIRNGVNYILSNNHVLARSGAGVAGERIDHPGFVDNGCSPATLVAKLTQAAPLQNGGVDAAIAAIEAGQVDTTGTILQLGPVSGGVPQPDAPASTVAAATVGMPIAKSGRTTGLTCGSVQAINVNNIQVGYSPTCGGATTKTITYNNQVITSANFSDAGDSGSLIVDSATAQPVALLFAGDPSTGEAVGNPIQQVLDAFKSGTNAATIVGVPEHPVSGCTGTAAQPGPITTAAEQQVFQSALPRTVAVKERHEDELSSDPAVLGVGIGASDQPMQPAIVIYVERGKTHRPIPADFEGVPTRVIISGRFVANDWDPNAVKQCSEAGKSSRTAIPPAR
jgi:hypothetical protein